jgi:hypothetical protein
MEDMNGTEYLTKIKNSVIENIRRTADASTQMMSIPDAGHGFTDDNDDAAMDEDDDLHPDSRLTQARADRNIVRDDEFEDSDIEDEFEKRRQPRSRITDHVNPLAEPGVEDGDIEMSGANGHGAKDGERDDGNNADVEDGMDLDEEEQEAKKSPDGSEKAEAAEEELDRDEEVRDQEAAAKSASEEIDV